ncbi:MAG: ATPase [Bacteroidota bacterium]|nr:ATPase [Bacteroidota bacterium]
MKKPIKKLEIINFKTAKKVSLNCKRINIIIGKPNVGKSNILEAISLLGGSYTTNDKKYLSDFVRYDRFEDLFYDKETSNPVYVHSDIGSCMLKDVGNGSRFYYVLTPDKEALVESSVYENLVRGSANPKEEGHQTILPVFAVMLSLEGSPLSGQHPLPLVNWHSPVKKYDFKKYTHITNRFHSFLLPPDGNNLYAIVNRNKGFFSEIASFFKEYNLQFKLNARNTEFLLQKDVDGVIYEYQYNLIADTLQRIIFYLMAIASNKESIIILEEPETHSFPRYTKLLAEKVIESEENQFFISTHSPFILNTIIENAPLTDVAVFIASYENFETKVKALTRKELEDMLNNGNDIFFSDKLNG